MVMKSMNQINKSKLFLPFFLAISLLSLPTYAEIYSDEDVQELFGFFDDNAGWSDSDEEFYNYMVSKACIDANTIIDVLTGEASGILLQDILANHNLYLKTYQPLVRPLHDLPSLHTKQFFACAGCNEFSLTLFYNQTRRMYFSQCSPFIDSYLALSDPDFLEELDRLDDILHEQGILPTTFDIPAILPLFSKIKLEERRTGGMLGFQRRESCCTWSLQIPLYYIEHNFYLNPQEQDAIANSPFFQDISVTSDGQEETGDEEVRDFMKQHLVNDLIGFGDTRLQVLWAIKETDCLAWNMGFEMTIPTAFYLKNGIVGSKFKKHPEQPYFSIFNLICLAQTDSAAAQAAGIDLGIEALDRIARIAAATSLGGHSVGLGGIGSLKVTLNDTLSWFNRFRLNYLFPSTYIRFFNITKNPSEFNRDYDNPDDAQENLAFLSQQFVNTIFPPAVCTTVRPGFITEFTTSLNFDYGCSWFEIGYDFWYEAQESIKIKNPCNNNWTVYDVQDGTSFSAAQNKVFAKYFCIKTWRCYDWQIGLVGDATFANYGLGKDWTIGLDLSVNF